MNVELCTVWPFTVTENGPEEAPLGTTTTIAISLQLVIETAAPFRVTVLDPCVGSNPVPMIVTDSPMAPDAGDKPVMLGVARTVKTIPLVSTPLVFTTTGPVVAPDGTVTAILVALQLVTVAVVPLNLTAPPPCVEPKFVPVMVTAAPTIPKVTDKLEMLGVGSTVNAIPFVLTPLAFTTTLPVVAPDGTVTATLVALQLVTTAAVPLKLTDPLPCVEPRFDPEIVTAAPTAPEVTDRLEILGVGSTVNAIPFVLTPLAFTTTFPVVAPEGTVTAILVALQLVTVAVVPLNLTVPLPCVEPKFAPVMVTAAPTAPEARDRVEILGVGSTVNAIPFVLTPLAFTTTLPVVAPAGTVVVMLPELHVPTVAAVPLKDTEPLPWLLPKLDPEMVTAAPTAPDEGDRLEMLGVGRTVKLMPLLACPETVTTTFPVVAPLGTVATILVELQLVMLAVVPLNFTVLLPCEDPKVVPAIVIEAPTAPELGVRLLMWGTTVKLFPLLATPPTVTTTFPVVAALGTVALILEDPQLVTDALVPLKVTVLLPCDVPKFEPVIVTDVPTGPDVGERLEMVGPAALHTAGRKHARNSTIQIFEYFCPTCSWFMNVALGESLRPVMFIGTFRLQIIGDR